VWVCVYICICLSLFFQTCLFRTQLSVPYNI
jgi:hypothetical protein